MGDNKSKRGRKRKNHVPETLDSQAPITNSSAPTLDDVIFSVSKVELIEPSSTTTHPIRRRGRPRKITQDAPEKTLVASPTRRIEANGIAAAHNSVAAEWENVARVVPSMDAVVKVFCVHTDPNFSLPWQRKRQYSSSSSGFVIGGRRVLTNAHSVEHYTQVKLKKRGSDTKFVATVLAIGTECDIGEMCEL